MPTSPSCPLTAFLTSRPDFPIRRYTVLIPCNLSHREELMLLASWPQDAFPQGAINVPLSVNDSGQLSTVH